jgi:hypothetical protein
MYTVMRTHKPSTYPTVIRVLTSLLVLASVFIFPWWLSMALGLLFLVLCKRYEMLFVGLLLDVLYVAPDYYFLGTAYRFTIVFLLTLNLVWIFSPYMRHLRRQKHTYA